MSESVQEKMELLRPELDAPARVSIFEEPTVVQGIEGNRRVKYSLMAFGGVLFFGLALVTFLEVRIRRIVKTEDAADDLGLRLIGTVPAIPRGAKTTSSLDGNANDLWQSMLAESVDVTRTVLAHSLDTQRTKHTILISSAMQGEGKTMLSCHLASSLARAGHKTLLVDGDMRRPTLHRVLETPQVPGLSELLRGENAPIEAIRSTIIPGLSLLPAGAWDTRVIPTLSTDRWETLKAQIEANYDYVIIDSSPLLLVTDPLLLGRGTEGVVLSVLWNVSQIENLVQARDRLKTLGIKIIGVVVNGLNGPGHNLAYPYYHRPPAPADTMTSGNTQATPV
jgi:capsular exopolysaccharide synthesis family protein